MLLHAGSIQVLYDRGFLRYMKFADYEIIRMIYFAIRDQDWETMWGTVTNERIQTTADTFAISYTYHVDQNNIKMDWQVNITGEADGTITFDIDGIAKSNFLKNRAGFCVLHPLPGTLGQSCRLEHPDQSFSHSTFPVYISPQQPFLNLSAMEWPFADQGLARLEFSGDIFETEDQRNWSDASFKTYCTPSSEPIPAQVNAGDQIKQQVIFRLIKPIALTNLPKQPETALIIQNQPVSFPEVGIGLPADAPEPNKEEVAFLRSLKLKHLRADIFLNQANGLDQLKLAIQQSSILQLPLELALFFGEEAVAEVGHLINYLQKESSRLKQFLIFSAESRYSTNNLLQAVVPVLRTAFPDVAIGGGSDANFTELNRNPFTFSLTDFITFALNPQVHAPDDLTINENAVAQFEAVKSARHLVKNLPIHVSPVTLKPRFKEAAASEQSNNTTPADSRQSTDFTATWTLASLKYLTEAGAANITYYETTGPRGIIQNGKPFAVGHLLKYLLHYQPKQVLPTSYAKPLEISSLLLLKDAEARLILANLTPEPKSIILPASFKVQSHTIIGSNIGQASYLNYLPGKHIKLSAYQIIALEGQLETDEKK